MFKGDDNIHRFKTINMYEFIKIRHNVLIQCHWNYMERKTFNYMLEIDILRNNSEKHLGVLRGAFSGYGCPKRHPDALLAKTMSQKNSQHSRHTQMSGATGIVPAGTGPGGAFKGTFLTLKRKFTKYFKESCCLAPD